MIMKKIVIILVLISFAFSCKQEPKMPEDTYKIDVTAKGVYNGIRAYITTYDSNRRPFSIDTAMVVNETFSFSGEVKVPSIKYLTIDGISRSLPFILEEGRLNIVINKDDLESSKITGSKNNEDYQTFLSIYKEKSLKLAGQRSEITELMKEDKNSLALDSLRNVYTEGIKSMSTFPHEYINKNPNSDFSLILLESIISSPKADVLKIKENYNALKTVINRNDNNKFIGLNIENFIRKKEATSKLDIGKVAPDFSAPSPDGEIIKLSDIKGKITLIDFWASWCKPCRVENPNVVKVYEKYHDKGLEIISVSLDKPGKKDAWLKAIKDDNLQWHHVSNLQYWNEPVAHKYQVRSIPATFLIDEEGKIIAKKLRGKALENKIAQLLD